jgi:catechol 2,3-dioxygenase-like lactoylglutathione lyase family enzyme
MIRGLSHFSFTVSDVDAAASWYVERLGFKLRRRQRQDTPYTSELVGLADVVLEVAILDPPGAAGEDTPLLELVQYENPASTGDTPAPGTRGFAHLSFVVDDIHSLYRDLVTYDVRFRSAPVAITAGVNTGGYVCYFVDPDGNGLELFQPAPVAGKVS